jgi:hypothetical protein
LESDIIETGEFDMPEQMTKQMEEWAGKFSEEYVDRNITSPEEFDNLLRSRIGFSRTEQIDEFLSDLELNNILEVGSNVGNQLLLLQKKGFENLCGYYFCRKRVLKICVKLNLTGMP